MLLTEPRGPRGAGAFSEAQRGWLQVLRAGVGLDGCRPGWVWAWELSWPATFPEANHKAPRSVGGGHRPSEDGLE